jgi:hypothetical protein
MCCVFAVGCVVVGRSSKQESKPKSAILRMEYVCTFNRMGEVNSPFFFLKKYLDVSRLNKRLTNEKLCDILSVTRKGGQKNEKNCLYVRKDR